MLEQRLEQDIKAALLAGESFKVMTLRGLKSTLLNVKVANGTRDTGLEDDVVLTIFAKESKKRQESADLYKQGGNQERYDAEIAEKAIIDAYLPTQLDEAALIVLIDQAIAATGASGPQAMGQVIGQVKAKAGAAGDGALIARLAKEKLQ